MYCSKSVLICNWLLLIGIKYVLDASCLLVGYFLWVWLLFQSVLISLKRTCWSYSLLNLNNILERVLRLASPGLIYFYTPALDVAIVWCVCAFLKFPKSILKPVRMSKLVNLLQTIDFVVTTSIVSFIYDTLWHTSISRKCWIHFSSQLFA